MVPRDRGEGENRTNGVVFDGFLLVQWMASMVAAILFVVPHAVAI
jgi:hypothetical protein